MVSIPCVCVCVCAWVMSMLLAVGVHANYALGSFLKLTVEQQVTSASHYAYPCKGKTTKPSLREVFAMQ